MQFHLWSPLHYFMMIGPFLFTVLLYFIYRNKDKKSQRKIGLILSLIAVGLLIARNIEIFVTHNYVFDYELVPLQICHFANFVLLYAFYKKSDTAFGLAFLFNLPLAFLSLLFADGLENYTTIINFRGQAYIWGHMLIVIITLYAYVVGFFKINIKNYFQVAFITTILYTLSVVVNNLFRIFLGENSNYFYADRPESGTPLDFFYNLGQITYIGDFQVNFTYIISLLFVGYIVIFLVYALAFELPKFLSYRLKRQNA